MNFILNILGTQCSVPSNDEEFDKWQKEIQETEAENEPVLGTVGGVFGEGDIDRPSTPPEGEEEFTDDDGTTYKWDRGIRAWVPQVGARTLIIPISDPSLSFPLLYLIRNWFGSFSWKEFSHVELVK